MADVYLPKQVLTFTASEYLKGTGPTTFTVEVMDDGPVQESDEELYEGYLTRAAAQTASDAILAARNTTWDNRPGVIFLQSPPTSTASGQSQSPSTPSRVYGFTLSNFGAFSDFEYSVDTQSRPWLPSDTEPASEEEESGGPSGQSEDTSMDFITDGTADPQPTTSLTAIKSRITEIAALIAAGGTTEGYRECVRDSLVRERYYRNQTETPQHSATITSGLAMGSSLFPPDEVWYDEYVERSVSGDDADLFAYKNTDNDTVPANGHFVTEEIMRPLPKGTYNVNFNVRPASYKICGFNPTHNNYSAFTVTVTPPSRTAHEAFFDPVTVGSAVKADGTNGVLKPTGFNVGITSTEMTGLEWNNNKVVLTLSPHVSLQGYALEFIELDGSVSLSLRGKEGTVNSAAGSHTWTVADQPWEDGDKLMLRIKSVPYVAVYDLVGSMSKGQSDPFRVTSLKLDPSKRYSLRLTTDNGNTGFSSGCTVRLKNYTSPPRMNSFGVSGLSVHACASPGGTFMVELLEGGVVIDRATQEVFVRPTTGPPAPSGVSASLSSNTFTISWNELSGTNNYEVEYRTGGDNGTWTDVETTTSTSVSYSPTGGAACGTAYEFRVRAHGDSRTYLSQWGTDYSEASVTTEKCSQSESLTFGSSSYSFAVAEDTSSWTVIGTVLATDTNEENSPLHSIIGGNKDGLFMIDGYAGLILLMGSLDYETKSSYTLTVKADSGNGETATTTVQISVTDVAE